MLRMQGWGAIGGSEEGGVDLSEPKLYLISHYECACVKVGISKRDVLQKARQDIQCPGCSDCAAKRLKKVDGYKIVLDKEEG